MKNATAEEAADTLKDYLVSVRPYLKKNITCIQTDAAASSPQKTGNSMHLELSKAQTVSCGPARNEWSSWLNI